MQSTVLRPQTRQPLGNSVDFQMTGAGTQSTIFKIISATPMPASSPPVAA
jgi:hypothetical protein